MLGWVEFTLAFVVFLSSHAIPPRTGIREWAVARIGEKAYLAIYVAVSVIVLGWLISAAGRAPYLALWEPASWTRWVPNLLMPVACLFFAFGAAAANPLSFGGNRSAPFDPGKPGIAALSRHPILLGFALWATGHLVANGDLAHVILFGFFLLMAIGGMFALDRRIGRRLGLLQWQALARNTSRLPVSPQAFALFARSFRTVDLIRVGAAIVLYAMLISMHSAVIGVSPLPAP